MGNWTKEGFIGKMFKTFARFISICCGRSSALPTWPPAPNWQQSAKRLVNILISGSRRGKRPRL
jgi:hypothetical protein